MSETVNETLPEVDENGNTIERDGHGTIVKITNPKGKEYVARNLSFRGDAETVKAVENYRWANELSVSEVLEQAVKFFLANEGQ